MSKMKACSIESCKEDKHYALGLCRKHWRQQYFSKTKHKFIPVYSENSRTGKTKVSLLHFRKHKLKELSK